MQVNKKISQIAAARNQAVTSTNEWQNDGNGAGNWQFVLFLIGGLFPETHRAVLAHRPLVCPVGVLFR